jgi:hypothetical protein
MASQSQLCLMMGAVHRADGCARAECREKGWCVPAIGGLVDTQSLARPPWYPQVQNTETAGGTRFSAGKPAMVWAPWAGMLEVCRVSEYGATKYAPLDWQRGQSFTTMLNSGMRHLIAGIADPQKRDPESGRLHLAHAAWNLLAVLAFIEEGRAEDLDDISTWHGVTTADKRARELGDDPTGVPTWEVTDG